jgi:hypothetical protein
MTDDSNLTPGGPDNTGTSDQANLPEVPSVLDQPDGTDWFLATLIRNAELGLEAGVTLQVGGSLVTGRIISGRKYFELLGEQVAQTFQMTGEGDREQWKAIVVEAYSGWAQAFPPQGEASNQGYNYIQLAEARICDAAGNWIFGENTLWRGKLAAVDGFIPGEIQRR